jgi:hypothetical protein
MSVERLGRGDPGDKEPAHFIHARQHGVEPLRRWQGAFARLLIAKVFALARAGLQSCHERLQGALLVRPQSQFLAETI